MSGSHDLSDTDWWSENDGAWIGYIPGWYGAGFCQSGFQPRWTGSVQQCWPSDGGLGVWFPSRSAQFSNPSGWCNYGYGYRGLRAHLRVNHSLAAATKHHSTHNAAPSPKTPASAANAHRASKAPTEVPDDDWTRVEDIQLQPVAATQRGHNQIAGNLKRGRPFARPALDRRHPPKPRAPRQVRADRTQVLAPRRVAQARVSAPPHVSMTRPAPHVAARVSAGRHS